ncbi:MAG: tRNA glutamyl-Q(34) synthetase GluQRS [Pseudomonadota bacterium]
MTGAGDGSTARSGAGRFAPSPTGPLHLGSLLAATASYLDAHALGLAWRVRLDDLDTPRNQPGAETTILRALEAHGLLWDGPVQRQSEHVDHYRAALDALAAQGLLFYCRCSRRDLRGHPSYPGTCRGQVGPRANCAVRIRVDDAEIAFDDLLEGPQHMALGRTGGDFVVRRRDGIMAYQLATAVDDGAPDITRAIRGRDLLDSTPRQIFLMRRLGLSEPAYGHLPLLVNAAGRKLSKQTRAAPLQPEHASANLARVLRALGASPDDAPDGAGCRELLAAAVARFTLAQVPRDDSTVP